MRGPLRIFKRRLLSLLYSADFSVFFADGFDWAGFKGGLALLCFFRSRRLLVNERVPVLVITGEIIGRFRPASVTVNTLIIHEEAAWDIVRPFFA